MATLYEFRRTVSMEQWCCITADSEEEAQRMLFDGEGDYDLGDDIEPYSDWDLAYVTEREQKQSQNIVKNDKIALSIPL